MGVIKEKITKDIQAQRSEGIVNSSKIDQAFAKYDLNVDEEEVKNKVKSIITDKVPENDNLDVTFHTWPPFAHTPTSRIWCATPLRWMVLRLPSSRALSRHRKRSLR